MRRTALTCLLTLTALLPTPAAADPGGPYAHYVALGDSYAAGPGIPRQVGAPAGCARSESSYPAALARLLAVPTFTDVTCSAATITHLAGPQRVNGGTNPPQLSALRPHTDLVTLTIGGNDMGFGEILSTCARLARADPTGAPCEAHYAGDGRDVLGDRIRTLAGELEEVLIEIGRRSPDARIVLVGYLRILPSDRGCRPQVPFADGDTPYFDATQRLLNQTLSDAAAKTGATFVNPYWPSTSHDACAAPSRRWVEPLLPATPSAPLHPNAKGMAVTAALTWLTLNRNRWGW